MNATAERSVYRRCLMQVRRMVLAAPLFLPLVAVIGTILGGACMVLSLIGAIGVSLACRLWRIACAVVFCAGISLMHGELLQRNAQRLQTLAHPGNAVQLSGIVERVLSGGVILSGGVCEPSVVVRGDCNLKVGEQVVLQAQARETSSSSLPGIFDAAAWMRGLGLAAEFYLIRVDSREASCSVHSVRAWGLKCREYLSDRLMPPETENNAARQVLCALVLGARDRAESETLDSFRRGGCLHAFAVSGLHVGLFSAILWGLLRFTRIRPGAARLVVMAGVGLYVLVTGASVPALRAYVLLLVVLGSLSLRRRANMLNTWSFAALLVLMIAPNQLYNAGFLLSFAVYAALCIGLRFCMAETPWFAPDSYIPARIYTGMERWMLCADWSVRGAIIVSLSAWLAATPITWLCFHTVNPWSVLTNLAITPVLPVVMFFGVLHLGLGWVPWVGVLTEWLAVKSAALLVSIVGLFGSLPAAWLPATPPAHSADWMIVGSGFGSSFTVLGNPGIVVNPGNADNVTFRTYPALFHAGFSPSAILQNRPSRAYADGADLLRSFYPESFIYPVDSIPGSGLCFTGESGTYTLYPAPAEYPNRLADSRAPIIRWEHPSGASVLYIGSSPAAAWYRMPPEKRKADVLIVGEHSVHPLLPDELCTAGAHLIIRLPDAEKEWQPEQVAPAALIQMKDDDWVRCSPQGILLNGLKWSAP